MNSVRIGLAVGVVGLVSVAAAPGLAQDRELVIGLSQYPSNLNPLTETHVAQSYIHGMARRPFTAYDADWEGRCYLCTALPSEEDGTAEVRDIPEELGGGRGWAVTYTIDPEAQWGDGEPITTEDVMFTWELGRNPQSGVINFELFNDIVAIDVADEHTFTIQWDKVSCGYEMINNFELVPAHLERALFEAAPSAYPERSLYETDPTNPGLWFGPYVLSELEFGGEITMTRNPLWWGDEPYFDVIRVRPIESTPALEANLLAGEIDMIAGEDGISIDQAIAFAESYGEDYDVIFKPALFYEHIDLNLDNPILADVRVRRALLHAIDREVISERLFAGHQPVAHVNINPQDRVYFGGIPTYEFDPERAAALLDEAGWTLAPGAATRTNPDGEQLALTLMTTAGNATRELVEQVLQSQWRRIGVDVAIKNEPARVLFGETLARRAFDSMVMFAWLSPPENVPRTTLHSSMIPTPENNWGGQNYTGYTSAEADAIIDDLEVTCDDPERQDLWNRLQELYAEDLPALPLYYRSMPYVLPQWLDGVTPTGHLDPTTLAVEYWRPREDVAD
ncbi:MAG: peptide ABC transporter substrate-binding protein [Alphaproteobacteria bacterium]